MSQLPNPNLLWTSHISGKELVKRAGGAFSKMMSAPGMETCASQLCHALNSCGDNIPPTTNYTSTVPGVQIGGDGHPHAISGANGYWYITSVHDMVVYLNGKYGEAVVLDAKNAESALHGLRGIIAYGIRHIDLWTRIADGTYNSHYYKLFNCASARKRGVFFWQYDYVGSGSAPFILEQK